MEKIGVDLENLRQSRVDFAVLGVGLAALIVADRVEAEPRDLRKVALRYILLFSVEFQFFSEKSSVR